MFGIVVHTLILILLFIYVLVSLVALFYAFSLVNNVSDGVDAYLDNSDKRCYSWDVSRRKRDIKDAMGFFDTLNAVFTPIFNVYVLYCLVTQKDDMRCMILNDLIVSLEDDRRKEYNQRKMVEYSSTEKASD